MCKLRLSQVKQTCVTALLFSSLASGQLTFTAHDAWPIDCTDPEAGGGERYLGSHPEDAGRAACLLRYYLKRLSWPSLRADRLRVILWVIDYHPDIGLPDLEDDRDLFVNPDDQADFAQARQLWLRQVELHPDSPRVLGNAAYCLKLSDREAATTWLKRARETEPNNWAYTERLAGVYAAAIAGITGEQPDGYVTSVNAAESRSSFAQFALQEASGNAILAARTGELLHRYSRNATLGKANEIDYDSVAEKLMLRAAELDYPKPAQLSVLRAFYAEQARKPSGRVFAKARIVRVSAEEQAERLTGAPLGRIAYVEEKYLPTPPTVVLDLIIGTDGHVWTAVPRSAPSEVLGLTARLAAESLCYRPLRIDGETVRVATTVEIKVEPYPKTSTAGTPASAR